MYNTINFQKTQEGLIAVVATCKTLLGYFTENIEANNLNTVIDKLIPTRMISLTTEEYSTKENTLLRNISYCIVAAYGDKIASLIQDVSYQVKDNILIISMITAYPSLLIGEKGKDFDRVEQLLKKEFINKENGFTDIQLNIIENQWNAKNYMLSNLINY